MEVNRKVYAFAALPSGGTAPCFPFDKLSASHSRSERSGEKTNSFPSPARNRSPVVQSVA